MEIVKKNDTKNLIEFNKLKAKKKIIGKHLIKSNIILKSNQLQLLGGVI